MIRQAVQSIRTDAARYGVSLSIMISYYTSQADRQKLLGGEQSEAWEKQVIANARKMKTVQPDVFATPQWQDRHEGLPAFDSEGTPYANKAVLFLQNVQSRAHAHPRSTNQPESAFIYESDRSGMIRHELLHIFGASDLYQLAELKRLTKRFFQSSVMIDAGDDSPVDPATAYLIGWVAEPDQNVKEFFRLTAHMTRADVLEEEKRMTMDRFDRQEYDNGAVYTGDLVAGKRQGIGRLVYSDGTEYTGDFRNGDCTGTGMLVYTDGGLYAGQMEKGAPKGLGIRKYPNGTTESGLFDGWKTQEIAMLTYKDGGFYVGQVEDGKPKGYGTRKFPKGSTQTGCFNGWQLHGEGIYVWGSKTEYAGYRYYGEFSNNLRHGWGVQVNPDGTEKRGYWENGKYMGVKKP